MRQRSRSCISVASKDSSTVGNMDIIISDGKQNTDKDRTIADNVKLILKTLQQWVEVTEII